MKFGKLEITDPTTIELINKYQLSRESITDLLRNYREDARYRDKRGDFIEWLPQIDRVTLVVADYHRAVMEKRAEMYMRKRGVDKSV